MNDRFFKNGKLIKIPKKYNAKIEVFNFFHTKFENGKQYSEKEVNDILVQYYDDYAVLRRYLVDFKYLNRDKSGRIYEKNQKEV